MDKMHLLLVLHSHQPVGNFDKVFAWAVERCYRPVLQILARYPEFRLGLHYSGPLLSWLKARDPQFLDELAELCARGQVEMLSGGYYEPLLASIPQEDALEQMEQMTSLIRRRFDQQPAGFWLAERIWEPALPAKLAAAGLKYTLVDDTHLYYAGLSRAAMFGYHLTEREGHALAIFPTHKDLRYTIPFKEPHHTVEFLRRAMDEMGPTCATYGDDTEKFGLWPKTYEWVIEKGWLTRFIEALLKEDDWLATSTPGAYLAEHPPVGRVYLPTASYEEMLTWALPAAAGEELERLTHQLKEEGRYESVRQFLRGGVWDNFLVKYRESNLMHKRMLAVSRKLRSQHVLGAAQDHLLQAQCNCAYWHGLFGGLYLAHLRHAVHEHLIAAEEISDRMLHGDEGWARSRIEDLDMDGKAEVILANPHLDTLVHPGYGGQLSILDARRQRFNLACVLTRRREAYHALFQQPRPAAPAPGEENESGIVSAHDLVVFKEEDLERHLVYDWYERGCFQDHLLPPEASLEQFISADYHEQGDFVNQPYQLIEQGTQGQTAWCQLSREGNLWAPGGPWPLTIDKRYNLGPGAQLSCAYTLSAARSDTPPLRLAVEMNLSLLSDDDPGKYLALASGEKLSLNAPHQAGPVKSLALVNQSDNFRLVMNLSRPAHIWLWPVETVSMSESGLERNYQGSSLSFIWELPAGSGRHQLEVALEVI